MNEWNQQILKYNNDNIIDMMELTKLSSKIVTSSRENMFSQFNSSVHKQFKSEGVRIKYTLFKFDPFAFGSSAGMRSHH